ncbi:uncharacterized protein LOC128219451 [Mya arenaria]|uniref:uncharacterized protein LOC128219451 n=1 Tax=Mya arenaria TaxID=6604 RepID=UPI0022E884B9|nr:uncharacterized protein LOC128219451 [Mya arenaria]
MDDTYNAVKEILNKKEDFIRRHIVLSTSVIQLLKKHDVIGQFTYDQMMANASNTDKQMTLLLVCIKTRGLASFQGFLQVLRITFHGWIADDILECNIDRSAVVTSGLITVRDVISKAHQDNLAQKNAIQDFKLEQKHIEVDSGRVNSRSPSRRHEYTSIREREKDDIRRYPKSRSSEVNSPITQIPENLRHLQRTFDTETASTRKSLAVLKQEEVTIKALLQQNLREQQDMLMKQETLIEIKSRIKEINQSAAHLFKPDPDKEVTRQRLRLLQSVPWDVRD